MGLAKPSIPKTAIESQEISTPVAAPAAPVYKARQEDPTAKGKTMCALLVAALQSPGIAQLAMVANGMDEYMDLVEKAAERAFKKVFPEG